MASGAIDLQKLGLSKKWPKLAKLQSEVKDLERRHNEANAEVQKLEHQLNQAKELDLNREAEALRSGLAKPAGEKQEPEARKALEVAERTRSVYLRALQAAQTDLGAYQAEHATRLYADIAQRRQEIAADLAASCRNALASYGAWADMHYLLRDMAPPEKEHGNFPTVMNVIQTTRQGPERGEVEGMLQYLISLSADTQQESGTSAA